jgi:hypothetical protein
MNETHILITLLRMLFHGTGNSAQLCQNFGISGGCLKPPSVRHWSKWPANSMVQCHPFHQSHNYSSDYPTSGFLAPTFRHHVLKNSQTDPIFSKLNPVHTFTTCWSIINFTVILLLRPLGVPSSVFDWGLVTGMQSPIMTLNWWVLYSYKWWWFDILVVLVFICN